MSAFARLIWVHSQERDYMVVINSLTINGQSVYNLSVVKQYQTNPYWFDGRLQQGSIILEVSGAIIKQSMLKEIIDDFYIESLYLIIEILVLILYIQERIKFLFI